MRFQYHHETRVTLNTGIDTAFAYLDRFEALSAHMEKRSPMMMGSRMHIDTDERGGRAVGSKVRMSGRVLGVALSLEEVVTERDPPRFKAWETREVRLLAIGHYRLGFELDSAGDGVDLRVFIEFQPPGWPGGRWLGRTSARIYARWCTRRIAHDAMRHFGGAVDLGQEAPERR